MTESEADQPRRSLTARIVIGMVAGLVLGVALNMLRTHGLEPGGWLERGLQSFLIDGLFYVVGAIFMASLKLLVVPLVFVSLVCGAASLDDLSRLGRIGGKTLGLYLGTTAIAISVALSAAALIRPGAGLDLPTNLEFAPRAAPGWTARRPSSCTIRWASRST